MNVEEAQREVRTVYLGGFAGGLVSGGLWLLSAAFATWGSRTRAIQILVIGGIFIFPLTQLLLRAMGRRASLAHGNPLRWLAMQVAFTVPLSLPLVGAATLHHREWFYPATLIVVGAHYLPFIFLYGMWQYAVLAAILLGTGYVLGFGGHAAFATGGWIGGVALVVFAFVGLAAARPRPRTP